MGLYQLAFGSNLKQQAHLRPPGSEIVRTVVIEVLRQVGIGAAPVRPFPAGWVGARPRPWSMTMAEQNEQAPAVCPKCSATLTGGRDLPGCWRCGREDCSQLGTGLAPLIRSSMSELAARGGSRQEGRARPNRRAT